MACWTDYGVSHIPVPVAFYSDQIPQLHSSTMVTFILQKDWIMIARHKVQLKGLEFCSTCLKFIWNLVNEILKSFLEIPHIIHFLTIIIQFMFEIRLIAVHIKHVTSIIVTFYHLIKMLFLISAMEESTIWRVCGKLYLINRLRPSTNNVMKILYQAHICP